MPAARRRTCAGSREAVRDFELRREDFLAVIDGMEMDVADDIRAPDWATLDLYCDRVASAVGRLSRARVRHGRERRACARASSRPRAAAHQHPARPRRGRRDRPALSAAARRCARPASRTTDPRSRAGEPGARPGLRAGRRARARSISPRPTRSWRAARAAPCGRRASWRRPIASMLERMLVERGWARAARRASASSRVAICSGSVLRYAIV